MNYDKRRYFSIRNESNKISGYLETTAKQLNQIASPIDQETDKLFLDLIIHPKTKKPSDYSKYTQAMTRSTKPTVSSSCSLNPRIEYQKPITSLVVQKQEYQIKTKPSKYLLLSPTNSRSSTKAGFFSKRTINTSRMMNLLSERQSPELTMQTSPRNVHANKILQVLDDTPFNSVQVEALYKTLRRTPKQYRHLYSSIKSCQNIDTEILNHPFRTISEYTLDKKPISVPYNYTTKHIRDLYKKDGKLTSQVDEDRSPFQQRQEKIQEQEQAHLKRTPMTFDRLKEQLSQPLQPKLIQRRMSSVSPENLEIIHKELDPLLRQWASCIRVTIEPEQQNQEEEWAGFASVFQPPTRVNHIASNIRKHTNKSYMIRKLDEENPLLYLQNIPALMMKNNFSRYEVHNIYTLYKALQTITSQRFKHYNTKDGLDFETFRAGIPQVFIQSYELAQGIFNIIDSNFSGFLNWREFLELMSIIRAKTICEKVDLFIKVADEDGNGSLSWSEIIKLCRISLVRFLPQQKSDDMLEQMSQGFTQFIFEILGQDPSSEIKLLDIKEAIAQEREGWQYLCLFCGADT